MYEASGTMEGSPTYSKGDIVWVKLSSYWWPGEVINEEDLPGDLLSDFKKPPLAIVKFFDEDSYEYVKNWSNIFPYNYHKKTEFIKKGMAGFRSKLSHMAKFPKDIGTAEERTSGNPNILSQPEFLPVKKINYDEIFGTPSPKKSTKGKVSLPSSKKNPARDNNQPHITHRRFLGNDDYRAYICIQYPGKDRKWDSDDEEIKKLNEEPEKVHNCHSCSFKTRRLEVMILHTKMHIQGIYVTSKRKTKKSKGPNASDSESDTAVTKSPKPKQRKKKEVKPKTADVFTNLLEEWDDTDEEMEEPVTNKKPPKPKKKALQVEKLPSDNEKEANQNGKEDQENESMPNKSSNSSEITELVEPPSSLKNTQDDIKNCFDFDEEEEDDDFMLPTSIGRKIPRVIPEKIKPSISELMEQSQKEDELEKEKIADGNTEKQFESANSTENGADDNKKEILRMSQNINREPDIDENIENTFKELMAETELPALDDLAQNLKPEQNFHDARTVKFPDKGGTTSKCGTSRKRFVTSFEDFEAGFRKLEDDQERMKKLGSDKEVKTTKMPNAPHVLLDESEDKTPITPIIGDTTGSKGNVEELLEVPNDSKKSVDACNSNAEIPERHSETRPQRTNNSASVKEPALKLQTDVTSIPSEEQKNAEQSDTVHIAGRRKTKQSNKDKLGTSLDQQTDAKENNYGTSGEVKEKSVETSLDQQTDVKKKNYGTSEEVAPDSRRKSRRRTKQFVIEEDSEEIIEITNEGDTDNIMDNSEEIIGHLDVKAREKIAAMDLEIDTIKRSLQSTQNKLEIVELCREREIPDQTDMVIESSAEEIVEVDSSKVTESFKTEICNLPEDESAEKTEKDVADFSLSKVDEPQFSEVPKKLQKSSLSNENVQKDDEKIKLVELAVPAEETPGKVKRKVSHRTHLKKESVSDLVEDLIVKSSLDILSVETQHFEIKSDSVSAGHEQPTAKEKRGSRSRGYQKNVDVDLKEKEKARPSRVDVDRTESKLMEVLEEPADSLVQILKSEPVTKLVEPTLTVSVETHRVEALVTTSTQVTSDQNIKIHEAGQQLTERETRDQLKKRHKALLEPIVPKPTPRSKRGKTRQHAKEKQLDKTISEDNAHDMKLTQPLVALSDVVAQESAIQSTESQTTLPKSAVPSSVSKISEPPKARRGRSQKHAKEDEVLPKVKEIIDTVPEIEGSEPKQMLTDIAGTDVVEQLAEPFDEKPTSKTKRGRTRKSSKGKEHSTTFGEHTSENLEIEHKQAEQSSAEIAFSDVSPASIPEPPEDLTLKPRRSRIRKDTKEREQDKTVLQETEQKGIISVTVQDATKLVVQEVVEQPNKSKNNILEPDNLDFVDKSQDHRAKKMSNTEMDVVGEQTATDLRDSTNGNVALDPELQKVSTGDTTVHEVVNYSAESQNTDSMFSQSDIEISVTKLKKSRTRKPTKEQVPNSFEEHMPKYVESEPIEPEPQKVSDADVTVVVDVNPLVETVESKHSQPDQEISVTKPRKGRTRKPTREEKISSAVEKHILKNVESEPIVSEPQKVSSTDAIESVPLAESQNTESMLSQPEIEISVTKMNKSRTRRQTKEELESNAVEEHISKNVELEAVEAKQITSDLVFSDSIPQSTDSQNTGLETVLSQDSIKNLESFSKTRSRHRKLSKEETQVVTPFQEGPVKDAILEVNKEKPVGNISTPETVAEVNKTQIVETASDSVVKISDEPHSKVRRGRSRKQVKEHEIMEPESNEAGANLTVSELIEQPAKSQTTVIETTFHSIDKIIDQPTPKARKSRTRKHVKGEGNVTEATQSKQSALFQRSDSFVMPEEQFSKTRRGRSRKLTKEEEDFARAIEESLKDIAQERNRVEATVDPVNLESGVQLSKINKSIVDPVYSDSVVQEPDDLPRKSKKGKSRKQSKSKELVSTVLNEMASKDSILGDNQTETTLDLLLSEKADSVHRVPEAKKRKSRLHTSDQISTALEENPAVDSNQVDKAIIHPTAQINVAHSVEIENTVSKQDFDQSLYEMSEQLTPSTRRGRTRKYARKEQQTLSEASTSIEPISNQVEEEETKSHVAKKEDTLSKQAITDSTVKIPEQLSVKSSRSTLRKHAAVKEVHVATVTEETITNEKQSKELTAALEFTKTVLELVESQQTTIKTENAAETVVQKDLEQKNIPTEITSSKSHVKIIEEPVLKIRRGRSRKNTENEDAAAIAIDANIFKDSIPKIKQTREEIPVSEIQPVISESISSVSIVNISHEPTSKPRKSKSRKNINKLISIDDKNSTSDVVLKANHDMDDTVDDLAMPEVSEHSINLNTSSFSTVTLVETSDITSKTKNSGSPSHSAENKSNSSIIEASRPNFIESTRGQKPSGDLPVPEVMEWSAENRDIILQAPMPNSTKVLEDVTLKPKGGKPRKHVVEDNAISVINECEPPNFELEPRLAANTYSQAETKVAELKPIVAESTRAGSRKHWDEKTLKDESSFAAKEPSKADMGSMGSIIQKAIDQSVATLDTIPKSGLSEWVGELLKISTSKEKARREEDVHIEETSNQGHEIPKPTQLEVHEDGSTVQETSQLLSDYQVIYPRPGAHKSNQSKVGILASGENSLKDTDITEVNQPKSFTSIEYGDTKSTILTAEISKDTVTKNKRRRSKGSSREETVSTLETNPIKVSDVPEIIPACVTSELEGQFETALETSNPDRTENSDFTQTVDTSTCDKSDFVTIKTQDSKPESDIAVETTLVKDNEKPNTKGKRKKPRKNTSSESLPIQGLTDDKPIVPISILQPKDNVEEGQGTILNERKNTNELGNLPSEVDTSGHHEKIKISELNKPKSDVIIESAVQKTIERSVATSAEFTLSAHGFKTSDELITKSKRRKSRQSIEEQAISNVESGQIKVVSSILESTKGSEQTPEELSSDKKLSFISTSKESIIKERKENDTGSLEQVIVATSTNPIGNDVISPVDSKKVQTTLNVVDQSYINSEKLVDTNLTCQDVQPDVKTLVQLPEAGPKVVPSTTLESGFQEESENMTPSDKLQEVVPDIPEQSMNEYDILGKSNKDKKSSVQSEPAEQTNIKDNLLLESKSQKIRSKKHSEDSSTLSKSREESDVSLEKPEINESIQEGIKEVIEQEWEDINSTDVTNITESIQEQYFKNTGLIKPRDSAENVPKIVTSIDQQLHEAVSQKALVSLVEHIPQSKREKSSAALVESPEVESFPAVNVRTPFEFSKDEPVEQSVDQKKELTEKEEEVLKSIITKPVAIQTRDPEEKVMESLSSLQTTQDKTGLTDKVMDGKRVLFEAMKRPPKKSRWSRRESYTKKDDDIDDDNLLKEQTVKSVPETVISEEVVIEEQIVEINNALETNSIVSESECVPDPNEDKNVFKNTNIIETNHPGNVSGILGNSFADLNDSEIILPPKKSKRANEAKFNFLNNSFASGTLSLEKKAYTDNLSFPSCDDSIMSTSLRNNIEGLIKDIDNFDNSCVSDTFNKTTENDGDQVSISEISKEIKNDVNLFSVTESREYIREPANISKCVPPKKKKIDFATQEVNPSVTDFLQNEAIKNEGKLADTIPQPPKKKIQKLFESSQALEKLGKANDIPQMSPLAKKKSFLFHQEEFAQSQKLSEISQQIDIAATKEPSTSNVLDDVSKTVSLDSTNLKTNEILISSLDSNEVEADENKSSTLPKKRKKRKSSSNGDHPQKKEKQTSIETVDTDDGQEDKNIVDDCNEPTVSRPQDEKEVLDTAKSSKADVSCTDTSVPDTPVDNNLKITCEHNKMEVKLEEDDFKFCIQTNLTNLATSTAKELSAIATATLSEIKNEVIVESSDQITSKESEQDKQEATTAKEDNAELMVTKEETVSLDPIMTPGVVVSNESEFVPISLNPTVMSEKDLADAQVEITTDKVISEKKPTSLGMFSMDFLETSHTSKVISLKLKKTEVGSTKITNTLGTEFTSKAMTKEFDNRALIAQPKAYALKSELLDILEGNSNSSTNSSGSDQKFKTSFDNYDKQTIVQGMFDFEEAIPSQIVLSNKVDPETVLMDSPKLLERLSMTSDAAKVKAKKVVIQSDIKVSEGIPKALITKITKPLASPKPGQKIIIKTIKPQASSVSKAVGNKPIILSEQIIRPANALKVAKPAIQPQGIKRQYEDIEDVETAFIIPKIAKKSTEEEVVVPVTPEKTPRSRNSKGSGKAKILQQTIITPKGEIIQPQTPTTTSAQIQSTQSQPDDTVFDINSMPIVISDDILTPESIQNMPVVLSEDVISHSKPVSVKIEDKVLPTLAKKVVPNVVSKHQVVFKTTQSGTANTLPAKQMTKPRILSNAPASTNKVPKSCTPALLATGTSADGKPTKYVLVPSTVTSAVPQVKAVKPPIIKKQPPLQSKLTSIQSSEPPSQIVGNKIMIVTNQHGQQTRVVLTPQQQKAFMQAQPGSKTKTIIKGAIPKALLESAAAGPSGIVQKPLSSVPQVLTQTVSSQGGLLMTVGKGVKMPVQPKKTTLKTPSKPQKTILIKNQMGQTVRKIQGTDDADLDRQVAEQLEAIKASARLQQANKSPEIINYTNRHIASSTSSNKTTIRRSYSKKIDPVRVKPHVSSPQTQPQKSPETLIPALAPLSPQPRIPQVQSQTSPNLPKQTQIKMETSPPSPVNKMVDTVLQQQPTSSESKITAAPPVEAENKPTDRPLTQLVIQDGLGNQTTITEGQILAIPSETVDGQPQSYMLVTLDEMGNITPLNNEALMSLDPSLGLGGDLNNMVLQVDQGQGTVAALKPAEPSVPVVSAIEQKKVEERLLPEPPKISLPVLEPKPAPVEQPKSEEVPLAVEQQIVIGEGVLPGADAGGQQLIVTGDPIATQKFLESLSDGTTDLANILANAEGGSVLIQADGQQILIKTNTGSQPLLGIAESTEGGGNPIFGTHKPNQDILAAALANTDVFQPSDQPVIHPSPIKGLQSSQLSPGGGAGVLYPMHVGNVLETSLTLNSPIMTPLEVPSLPIKKIDDDVDILNQVPKNVDLPITITDPNISQTVAQQQAIGLMELTLPISETTVSNDINSPSYTYSLPSLDEPIGHAQKPFNGSMPLLTEDVTEIESSDSSQIGKIRVAKGLQNSESSFSSNFGSLPLLPETIESSREEVVKTTCFGEIGSMRMLAEDVIEDSGSSIGSSKQPRSSPKSLERDIVDEGLSTLGGEMCSSLSEPPPDMFDLASITVKEEEISSDMSSIPEPEGETLSLHSENSGEIPLQPPIVANLNDLKRPGEETQGQDEKRQKFD